jgi:hypothetical protein
MRKLPLIPLTTAIVLGICACKRGQEAEISELDAVAARASFVELVGSELDVGDLSARVSSALVRHLPGQTAVEIVYAFRRQGGMLGVEPFLYRFAAKWPASDDRNCWLPWERFLDPQTGRPGPFMGAYRAQDFQLSLWIDQLGRDLFVCYQSPAPAGAPTPEAPGSLGE